MSEIVPFLTAYLVLLGVVMGSFINLSADRVPRGESVVRPRSHCRACGRTLNFIDLLPVIGYVLRAGRCATCHEPIGIFAPVVETVPGVCMLAGIVWLGLWPGGVAGLASVALWGTIVVGVSTRRHSAATELADRAG